MSAPQRPRPLASVIYVLATQSKKMYISDTLIVEWRGRVARSFAFGALADRSEVSSQVRGQFLSRIGQFTKISQLFRGRRSMLTFARVGRSIRTGVCKETFASRKMAAALALMVIFGGRLAAQTNIVTQHYDISRSGANTTETILTPANVNAATFGKLFRYSVDAQVYAEPLYVAAVTMGAGTSQAGTVHNVVFVATQNDSIYAFDADSVSGANANPLWQITLLDVAHGAAAGATSVPNGDVSTADINPIIGITGTPVIDLATGTLYVVGKTLEGSAFVQRLHALDITTGLEKFGAPVALSGQVSGTGNGSSGGVLKWDPKWENQRPGLLELNGIIYIGFAAHGDNGPWHGWILAYNAATLAQTGVWCTSPNGLGSGIWMSGAGLAADIPSGFPYGRMFVATGNGDYTASTPYTNQFDYGDSIVRLDLTNGVPTVRDEFTPYNQATLNSEDADVASGGVLILPDQTTGAHLHELVQVGKDGVVHLVDRDTPGEYSTTADNIVQEVAGQTSGLWSIPAYWNGTVYFGGQGSTMKAFSLTGGLLSTTPTSSSTVSFGYPGDTPVISSNGTTNGIVWAVRTDAYNSAGPAILYALNAGNLATQLYASNQYASDTAGAAVKFVVPTVTNGKVYFGAAGEVDVYGLGTRAAMPVITPSAQTFTGSLSVTITDATTGATIYYTLDGSTPTTASAVYSGALTVSSTETVTAIAIVNAIGNFASGTASQSYTLNSQTPPPTFSPIGGSYATPQSVTLSDSASPATIYYTIDGSTPSSSSPVFSSATPLSVSATTTINAFAVSGALTASPIASATYTIANGGTAINYSNGFSTSASTMTFNGSTDLDDTRLQLTNGNTDEAGSAFVNIPISIQTFTTDFAFQLSNPSADGFTFTIQGNSPTALGPMGGGLGYGPDAPGGTGGIPNSVAVKFDLYSNAGEGVNSTGLYLNGASPTTPAIDLTSSGINLHSGDTMAVHMTYNGTTLAMTITDAVANATFSTSWTVNIPAAVGGNTAYVGFTGGTGGLSASQKVETWTFVGSGPALPAAATPVLSLAAGTYLGTQMVSITDATSGATIYYTTDGTMPTTSSAQYTTAISVTASETVTAIATASNYSPSLAASAAYVIESQLPAPSFTPAGGTYLTSPTVTLSDAISNAAIYYTTNGTTPTTSSTPYTGPIMVSAPETIQAIAAASGYFNSNVVSASYTIGTPVTSVSLGSGFSAGAMILNGNTTLNGTRLRLTDGGANEVSSAWYPSPVNIGIFTTTFTFQITGGTSPQGEGLAFVIQGDSTSAIGPGGGGLGYGPDNVTNPDASPNAPIGNSVAIKFDIFSNAGEGVDSTGLYVNGASPTIPFVDMSGSGVYLIDGDTFSAKLTYDGTNLTMVLTDLFTGGPFTQVWPINIPATIGGNSAFLGFTGGTSAHTAIQDIISWTVSPVIGQAPSPTFSPAPGTFLTPQNVTISDAVNGLPIYYTTNGSTPTTSSSVYSSPIPLSTNTTIAAIAASPNYSASYQNLASYTFASTVPAPTFSPTPGSYGGAMGIGITDAVSAATIYYTTDGSTPTTSSAKYSSLFWIYTTTTINAIAVVPGYPSSPMASGTFTLTAPPTPTPTFSPAGGTYSTAPSVSMLDSLNNALIFYTTNGSTPTPYSTPYQGPITVSSGTTIKAIAWISADSSSAVASATYTIAPPAATPVISPVTGTYPAPQMVTITDTTPGATIYYTTNGSAPTTSSPVYTTGFAINTTTTVQAIAVAPSDSVSALAASTVTISGIGYGSGFTGAGLVLNGSAAINGTRLRLTNGGASEAASAWSAVPVNTQTFTTNFTFQLTSPNADGFTFAIQNSGTTALGADGGSLGYAGIAKSIAVKFDLYNNSGEGNNSTGLYLNGAKPILPATTLGGGVNLHSGDIFQVGMTYDGATLIMTITDTVTKATFTQIWAVNIPSTIGGSTAYVGFTGGTGGATATQDIISWTFASTGPQVAAATPTFNPVGGTYVGPQTVVINDATTGASIFYTLNGSTPTASSAQYSGAIIVTAPETVNAIAVAPGYATSAVGTAAYGSYGGGFTGAGLALNGSAAINGTRLRLTNGGANEMGSAWSSVPVNVQTFTTNFTFQLTSPNADGFTFAIQNSGTTALGSDGGSLGYAGIAKSIAVKFDLYNNSGEGNNSTGLYLNGAKPILPATTLGGGVNLHSGDIMNALLTYNGTTLTLTITDTTNTALTFTIAWAVNIPSTIGSNTAYVGFTGGTGGATATQDIITWSYNNTP
jgi:Legume lectin domain/Chitobiase/beta-hexosaminidase C-terminal domain